jgi:hypothetical protein
LFARDVFAERLKRIHKRRLQVDSTAFGVLA